MKFKYIYLILFCMMVFLMPYYNLKLLSIQAYELTLSDGLAFILLFFILIVSNRIYIKKEQLVFVVSVLFFIVAKIPSGVKAINLLKYFLGFLPFIYAMIIVFVSFNSINVIKVKNILNFLFYIMTFNLILSFIGFYLGFLGVISPISELYSGNLWRYKFFTQNPNQYAVFVNCSFYILSMIGLKSKGSRINFILILSFISLLPILASGSRTGLFSNVAIILLLLMYLLLTSSIKNKIYGIAVFFLILIISSFFILDFLNNQSAVFERSFSIFATIASGKVDPDSIGTTGKTIKEGMKYFYENPLLGIGLSNMHSLFHHEIHNTFVATAAETGIIGLLGFFILIFTLIYIIYRSNSNFFQKLLIYGFLILFLAMTYAHHLLRQRWVWLFFVIIIIVSNYSNQLKNEKTHIT